MACEYFILEFEYLSQFEKTKYLRNICLIASRTIAFFYGETIFSDSDKSKKEWLMIEITNFQNIFLPDIALI